MGLINDQRVVGAEIPVVGELSQQDAVGHELDGGSIRDSVVKADLVTDQVTKGRVELVRDALRDGARCDTPRLSMANTQLLAAAQVQTNLR